MLLIVMLTSLAKIRLKTNSLEIIWLIERAIKLIWRYFINICCKLMKKKSLCCCDVVVLRSQRSAHTRGLVPAISLLKSLHEGTGSRD